MMETVSQFECPHCSWKKLQSLGPMKLISGSSIPLWRPPSKIVSMKEKRFPSKPLRWRQLSVPPTFFSFSRPLSPRSNDMYQHVFLLWGAKSHARWKRCDPHKSIHTSDLDDQLSNFIHKLVCKLSGGRGSDIHHTNSHFIPSNSNSGMWLHYGEAILVQFMRWLVGVWRLDI